MNALRQMVHTALRDDSSLRTTIGHAATPYGIYEGFAPEVPDYTSLSYAYWQFLGGAQDEEAHGVEMRLRTLQFSVTVLSANPDTVETAHQRIRRIFNDKQAVTLPSTEADVHEVRAIEAGPNLYDEAKQVYFRAETYRIRFREVITA